ncbi:hypothetical protein D0Z06_19625 [Geodermatophilus marinus]|nr:hypothetical protein D0Z06_19625 [Geodermatophilus sp. LHW52908]
MPPPASDTDRDGRSCSGTDLDEDEQAAGAGGSGRDVPEVAVTVPWAWPEQIGTAPRTSAACRTTSISPLPV